MLDSMTTDNYSSDGGRENVRDSHEIVDLSHAAFGEHIGDLLSRNDLFGNVGNMFLVKHSPGRDSIPIGPFHPSFCLPPALIPRLLGMDFQGGLRRNLPKQWRTAL